MRSQFGSDVLKAAKKILPVAALLVIVGIFVFSAVNEKTGPAKKVDFVCGSEVTVTVFGGFKSEEKTERAIEEAKRLDSFVLSDTIPTSATYLLNENGKYTDKNGELVSYIKECKELTDKCEQMTLLSKPFVIAWDIAGEGRIPSSEEIDETVKKADMNNLSVVGNEISLSNGALLSFGAFGKGTVCEKAVETLKEQNVKSAIVTVGGTVGVLNTAEKTYSVGIRNPFGGSGDYFATVNVNNGYLSTSGDYEKFFEKDGKRYCHIFDAATGLPVKSDITSVTIITDGGTKSDFLSTAIFILGEGGIDLAHDMNAEVIIVKKDKSVIISKSLEDKFELKNKNFTVTVK